jgi:hypothetical protein
MPMAIDRVDDGGPNAWAGGGDARHTTARRSLNALRDMLPSGDDAKWTRTDTMGGAGATIRPLPF